MNKSLLLLSVLLFSSLSVSSDLSLSSEQKSALPTAQPKGELKALYDRLFACLALTKAGNNETLANALKPGSIEDGLSENRCQELAQELKMMQKDLIGGDFRISIEISHPIIDYYYSKKK
jgi:hypothetical protein